VRSERDAFSPAPRFTYAPAATRLFGSLPFQVGTHGDRVVWVHSALVKFDVLNFSFLVHNDRSAARPLEIVALNVVFLQDAVFDQGFAVHVAQQRHGDVDLFGKGGVGGGTVYTDSEDDGVGGFELGLISLIGLEFLRSATGESQDVEGEDDVFLATEIAQLHRLPLIAKQSEIRGHVAHLQSRLGNCLLLLLRRGGELSRGQHQKQAGKCQDASLHLRSFE